MRKSILPTEVALWAYGPGYESEPCHRLPGRWNRLHPMLFFIELSDDPGKVEPNIIREYEANKYVENLM